MQNATDPTARIPLLFFVEDPASLDADRCSLIERAVADIINCRKWQYLYPEFVDHVDEASSTDPDDVPIRTVGGILWLPPHSSSVKKCDEFELVQDCRHFIVESAKLSLHLDSPIVYEFNGIEIGEARGGNPCREIEEHFLKPWETQIGGKGWGDSTLTDVEAEFE